MTHKGFITVVMNDKNGRTLEVLHHVKNLDDSFDLSKGILFLDGNRVGAKKSKLIAETYNAALTKRIENDECMFKGFNEYYIDSLKKDLESALKLEKQLLKRKDKFNKYNKRSRNLNNNIESNKRNIIKLKSLIDTHSK